MKNYSCIGNDEILKNYKVGFFCSQKCPPDLILPIYDKAKEWRENKACVISGFHTTVEKDVLHYLLKGEQPVIICPARSLEKIKIDSELKKEIEKGRVLLISNLPNKRISKKYSLERNLFVAEMADEIIIGYAKPGGTLEKICEDVKKSDKKIFYI